ncbi:MAG: hypothetical protein ABJC74_04700 [Gemmatimonadota bacterium]
MRNGTTRRTWVHIVLGVLSLVAAAAGSLEAQRTASFSRAFRFAAGPSFYRFDSHTGTGVNLTLGVSHSLGRHLILDASLSDFDLLESNQSAGISGSNRTRLLMPEVDLALQAGSGELRPFVAIGAGGAIRLDGFVQGGATLNAAVGLRWLVGRRIDLLLEARARTIRPFEDRMIDATVGIEVVKW